MYARKATTGGVFCALFLLVVCLKASTAAGGGDFPRPLLCHGTGKHNLQQKACLRPTFSPSYAVTDRQEEEKKDEEKETKDEEETRRIQEEQQEEQNRQVEEEEDGGRLYLTDDTSDNEEKEVLDEVGPALKLCNEDIGRCVLLHRLQRHYGRYLAMHNVRPVFMNISSRANYYGLSESKSYGIGWNAGNRTGRARLARLPPVRGGGGPPRDEHLNQYKANDKYPWWLANNSPRPV